MANCSTYPNEVTVPIDSLDQLIEWQESSVERCLIGQSLNDVLGVIDKKKPRTLVCHDMAGGYVEDRFAHGCVADTVYYLREWSYIDIFVYFSHHFVTIPPVGWINSAHTHNVPVLGTFITEWAAGETICTELFTNSKKLITVVDQLAQIASKYNFDGWLLNIENPVEEVANLITFVGLLTAKCKEIIGPRAMVIWYDSVTINGQLEWQDELNEKNKSYFDVCDGIFLNYAWNETKLDTSIVNAGDRILDVYVGVDVFGRGCMGGGGFNCYEPLNFIRQRGLSTAFFAPGWVFENLNKKEFERNQRQFWAMLAPGLHCKKIKRLPFSTNFGPGKRWYPSRIDPEGTLIDRFFFSLRDQELQPHWFCPRLANWPTKEDENGERFTWPYPMTFLIHDYAPNQPGGAALKTVSKERDNRLRLFCCDLISNRPIRLSFTYQIKVSTAQIGLALTFRSKDGHIFIYVLPQTMDKERIRAVFDVGSKISYCQTSTVSIRSDVEMMVTDLLNTEEILESIDLLILTMANPPVDCTVLSISLNYCD